jgi:hypothetical protein
VVDPSVLDAYVGRYVMDDSGFPTVISRRGGMLAAQGGGVPIRLLTPTSDTQFVDKLGIEWTFYRAFGTQPAYLVFQAGRGNVLRRGTKVN